MSTTAEQFLLGGGGKSASFDHVGASITGTIAAPPQVKQQTDMKTGQPDTWDNGDPKMQLVVQLQTSERTDADDDGVRNLYVKGSKKPESQSLHAAVAGAVMAAGAKGLEVGGTLTVTYVADGVAPRAGFNPPKKYSATYQPPNAADFLGTGEAERVSQPAGAPAPATFTNAQGVPATRESIAALRAAGVDPAAVYPGYDGSLG